MGKAILAGEKMVSVKSKTGTFRVMDTETSIHAHLPNWKRLCSKMKDFFQSKAESDWEKEIDFYRRGCKRWWYWQ